MKLQSPFSLSLSIILSPSPTVPGTRVASPAVLYFCIYTHLYNILKQGNINFLEQGA